MKRFAIAYVILGVLSAVLATGWLMAEFPHRYPHLYENDGYRLTLGRCMSFSILIGLGWPIALPEIYFLTGFAEYGWSVTNKKTP